MPIDGRARNNMVAGMRLVARYKGQQHTVEVTAGEDGKLRFRLADGREFKSPSAAGSAILNGQACNGWRFFSLEGTEPPEASKPALTAARSASQTPDEAPPLPRPTCGLCGKTFVGATQLAHHNANADRLCKPA